LAIRYLEIFRQAQSEDIVSVLPSDHLIEPKEIFLDYLKKAEETARSGKIILFGIYPSNPNTGFGYLKIGMPFDSVSYTVEKFIEKPSLERGRTTFKRPSRFLEFRNFCFFYSNDLGSF